MVDQTNKIMIGDNAVEIPEFKVILLGASSVGKTSIITSFK